MALGLRWRSAKCTRLARARNSPRALKQALKSEPQSPLLHRALARLKLRFNPFASADYQHWQYRFLRSRLKLYFRVVIAGILAFTVLETCQYLANPQLYDQNHSASYAMFLAMSLTSLTTTFIFLFLYHSQFGRQYPALIFLGLSWSSAVISQIFASFNSVTGSGILSWTLLFTGQAGLIPVRWTLHLASQAIVLAYYLVIHSVFHTWATDSILYEPSPVWLWIFWLCLICDVGVYLYERLQQAEFASRRELNLFPPGLSDELRRPVISTSIVLQRLLQQRVHSHIHSRDMPVEQLLQSSDRQLAGMNSLLEADQSPAQELILHLQSFQLRELVDFVLDELQPVLDRHGVEPINQVSPALPPVKADLIQIWRVLNHFISHAVKQNPPGIQLQLSAEPVQAADPARQQSPWMLCCIVQDDGGGIPEQQDDRPFELHSRDGHTPDWRIEFSRCRQIVEAHGGQMGAVSQPGAGIAFWFTLPIAASEQKA